MRSLPTDCPLLEEDTMVCFFKVIYVIWHYYIYPDSAIDTKLTIFKGQPGNDSVSTMGSIVTTILLLCFRIFLRYHRIDWNEHENEISIFSYFFEFLEQYFSILDKNCMTSCVFPACTVFIIFFLKCDESEQWSINKWI